MFLPLDVFLNSARNAVDRSPRFKSLIKNSLFILILHGDYVFILIVYSWPLAGEVT